MKTVIMDIMKRSFTEIVKRKSDYIGNHYYYNYNLGNFCLFEYD